MFKIPGLYSDFDPDDIAPYPTAQSLFKCGCFTPEERKREYKRRGKGLAG